jgi:hypothetical protein
MINKLDKDRIEFERMIDCMRMDMYYLEEELVLDQAQEEVEEDDSLFKNETAVITPELIEKSKQSKLKTEETKKSQSESK